MSPDTSSLQAWSCQQPGVGNLQPVPHSSPRRCHVEPPWASGPHTGPTIRPSDPIASIRKEPDPVIRHTIFNSAWTRAGGVPTPTTTPHSDEPRHLLDMPSAPPVRFPEA